VKITLYNLIGKSIGIVTDQIFPMGSNLINFDVSQYSTGSYVLTYQKGVDIKTCKVLIIR